MKFLRSLIGIASVLSMLTACSSKEEGQPVEPDKEPTVATVEPSIIYQADPRSFALQDGLNALTTRIPQISNMGIDVLWVMPVCTLGEEKGFGSPYCIRDFKNVNGKLGTLADFRNLVKKAHEAGMKVILDWIANHTAWDHAWIKEHPDYYVKDASGNISMASSWTDVAQLNFKNSELRTAMIDAMKFWVTECDVDGFRCDYADGPSHIFWKEAIPALRASKSDLLLLAESADASLYDDGFDMIYGWAYSSAIADLFNGKGDADRFFQLEAAEAVKCPEGKSIMRYALNHDTAAEKAIQTIYGSYEAIPAVYFLTAMLGQAPMIYSVMESDVRSGKVSFFEYKALNWSEENAALYKAINNAVKATAAARSGKRQTYRTGNAVTFSFTNGDMTALVMVNPTGSDISVKVPIAMTGITMKDGISGIESKLPAAVELQPYGYKVYYK